MIEHDKDNFYLSKPWQSGSHDRRKREAKTSKRGIPFMAIPIKPAINLTGVAMLL